MRKSSKLSLSLSYGGDPVSRSAVEHRHRVDLNAWKDGDPRGIGSLLSNQRFFPSTATDFVRYDQHHEVIGGCIEVEQQVMGIESKIIGREHGVTLYGWREAHISAPT